MVSRCMRESPALHVRFAPGMLQRWLLSMQWDVRFSCRHAPRLRPSGTRTAGGTRPGTAGDRAPGRSSTC